MFSILIPSLNNLEYLKLCIHSIKQNSEYNHEIIVHVNEGKDNTIDYLKTNNIKYTHTEYNAGICEGVNKASKLSTSDYILYAHDDFYFYPGWDSSFYCLTFADIQVDRCADLCHENGRGDRELACFPL